MLRLRDGKYSKHSAVDGSMGQMGDGLGESADQTLTGGSLSSPVIVAVIMTANSRDGSNSNRCVLSQLVTWTGRQLYFTFTILVILITKLCFSR